MTVVPNFQCHITEDSNIYYTVQCSQPQTLFSVKLIQSTSFFHVACVLILSSERRIGLLGCLLPSDSPATSQLATIRDTLSHSLYTADTAATDCEV